MMACKLHRFVQLSPFVLLALAACGGGGGGGGGSPSPTSPAITLANVSVPVLPDETYENGDPTFKTLEPFQVSADLQGDLSSLSGKTVYVVVEDPHGFIERATIQQPITETRNTLVVETKTFGPPKGRYTGSFRISVCYDAACTTQFGGSPIAVPYDIEVLQGLVLNNNAPIEFAARPNEVLSLSFPLTLPEGLLYHSASLPPPVGGQPQIEVGQMSSPSISWQVSAGASPTGTIVGSIPAGVTGEYLWARAQVQTPKGKLLSTSAQVKVNYKTLP